MQINTPVKEVKKVEEQSIDTISLALTKQSHDTVNTTNPDGTKKRVKYQPAGIDGAVQSKYFDEIRAMPTGGYARSPIVEKLEPNEGFASMTKDQLNKKVKNNFKGIFQTTAFDEKEGKEFSKLPKLLQATSPNFDRNNPNKTGRAAFDFQSPNNKNKFRATSLDTKVKLKKGQGVFGSHTQYKQEQDPIQGVYSSAQKQIRENVAKAALAAANYTSRSNAAVQYQKNLFARSNNFSNLQRTVGSNENTRPSDHNSRTNLSVFGATGGHGGFGSGLPRNGTFTTIQGLLNQGSEEITPLAALGGTLAGAKNTKYKAMFRLNQNSQANSNYLQPIPSPQATSLANLAGGKSSGIGPLNQELDLDTLNEELRDTSTLKPGETTSGPKGGQVPFPARQLGPEGLLAGTMTSASGNLGHMNSGYMQSTSAHDQYVNDVMEMSSGFLGYGNAFSKGFQHDVTRSPSVNALEANINSVRDFKFAQLESYKDQVSRIHSKLMTRKEVCSGGNSSITSLQMLLGPRLKEQFLQQQGPGSINHNHLFKHMNNLNGCFLDILDSVCSYKAELGVMLQRLVESYSSIFLQQYSVFYEGKLAKEKELELEIGRFKAKQGEADGEVEKLHLQQDLCRKAVQTKDNEIERLLEGQRDLERQIEALKAIIKRDEAEGQTQQEHLDGQNKEVEGKPFMADGYDKSKRMALKHNPMSEKHLLDPANIDELKEVVALAGNRIEDRNEQVERLYEVTKSMLTAKQASVKTQTDEACMNNAIMYDYYSYGSSDSDKGDEAAEVDVNSPDAKLKKLAKEKGYKLEESEDEFAKERLHRDNKIEVEGPDEEECGSEIDTVPDLGATGQGKKGLSPGMKGAGQLSTASLASASSKSQNRPLANQNKEGDGAKHSSSKGSHSKLSRGGSHAGRASNKGRKPDRTAAFDLLDPPATNFHKNMRQIGIQNANKLKHLHELLDAQATRVKKRKLVENNEDPNKQRREQWRIPYSIVAFVQNRIFELDDKPAILEAYELMPWFQLKEILFDVYDHRVKHAPELNGSVNTAYCSLAEHLPMFFLEKYRKRQKAEERLVDLLINLRYYFDSWQRAKLFARNLELIYMPTDSNIALYNKAQQEEGADPNDEFGDLKEFKAPHAYLKDTEYPDDDLFTQEFFLHAYSLLCSDRANFLESAEGMTYVRLKHHDKVVGKVLQLIRGGLGDPQKWNLKVRRMVKRIKNKQGAEADYLDLDAIMGMLLDLFREARGFNQKSLLKCYARIETAVGQDPTLDLDQFIELINDGILQANSEMEPAHPLMQYPGKMAQIRAYVYACLSGESNTNAFGPNEFVAACSRFSLENPVPSVSFRCALYGNSRDIIAVLTDAESKLAKNTTRFDPKLYTPMNMGLPEKRAPKQGNIFFKEEEKGSDDENVIDSKRKPTIAVHETPRAILKGDTIVSFKDMKFEYLRHLGMKDSNDPLIKSGRMMAGGVKFKVAKIKKQYADATELERFHTEKAKLQAQSQKPQLHVQTTNIGSANPMATVEVTQPDKIKPAPTPTNEIMRKRVLTDVQFGLTQKQIIVPSFETTAELFSEHFLVLRELKYKIDLLKQAYFGQMDKKKTWKQVDEIISVLNAGCQYLDFPLDTDLKDYIVESSVGYHGEGSSSIGQSPARGKGLSPIKSKETIPEGQAPQSATKVDTALDHIAEENENSASQQGTNHLAKGNGSQFGDDQDGGLDMGDINEINEGFDDSLVPDN